MKTDICAIRNTDAAEIGHSLRFQKQTFFFLERLMCADFARNCCGDVHGNLSLVITTEQNDLSPFAKNATFDCQGNDKKDKS